MVSIDFGWTPPPHLTYLNDSMDPVKCSDLPLVEVSNSTRAPFLGAAVFDFNISGLMASLAPRMSPDDRFYIVLPHLYWNVTSRARGTSHPVTLCQSVRCKISVPIARLCAQFYAFGVFRA